MTSIKKHKEIQGWWLSLPVLVISLKKMKNLFLFAFCFIFSNGIFAQQANARNTCDDNYCYYYYVKVDDKRVSFNDTLTYYWFRSQKIHATVGAAGGNVLDGAYAAYYMSGQLKEKGVFMKGLKHGSWKEWRDDGSLISVKHYRKGKLHGTVSTFNERSKLIDRKNFKKGELTASEQRLRLPFIRKKETEDIEDGSEAPESEEMKMSEKESEKQGFFARLRKKKDQKKNTKNPPEEKKEEGVEKDKKRGKSNAEEG